MIKKADKILFTKLAKENMMRAYFSALAIVGNHDDATELSQKAFLRAYENFHKYDRKRKFFTWYYKILRNLCFNYMRDSKNRRERVMDENFIVQLEFDVQEEIEKNEDAEIVRNCLTQLEEDDREILMLKEFEKLSYKEIAEMLEIPLGSVMSRLHYARKKLAQEVKK